MTLAALLEELKEVDVKVYDDIEVSRRPTEEFTWYDLDADESIHVSFGEAVGRITRDSPQYQDIIQGCIQRACERREWDLKQRQRVIKCDGPNEHHHYAEIDKGIAGTFEPIGYEGWGDSPAEALLAAYIAAVRA